MSYTEEHGPTTQWFQQDNDPEHIRYAICEEGFAVI